MSACEKPEVESGHLVPAGAFLKQPHQCGLGRPPSPANPTLPHTS